MSTATEPIVTVFEAAKLVKLSERHVRRLIKAKKFPHFRSGDRILISREALNEWIAEQTKLAMES